MIPAQLHNHVTIEETQSLTDSEMGMLLYICNVVCPMEYISTPENPFPITLTLIRAARREAVLERVARAEVAVKDQTVYNGLRAKLGLAPVEVKAPELPAPTVEPEKKFEDVLAEF
jgi:hypothetical protein